MADTDSIQSSPSPEQAATLAATEPWRTLVGQIGAEVAGPLSAAMERIHILTGTGRIDRRGLRALRNEVDAARQVGLVSQQIARLATGQLSQSPERLQLVPILKGVVAQRARDIETRGVQIRQLLQPAEVVADAPLLFSLLNTMLDWALANARSPIEFRTDIKIWPAHARLSVHFAHAPLERTTDAQPAFGLDSLIWRLLQQTASSMGLSVARHIDETHTELMIEFPQTVQVEGDAPAPVPADEAPPPKPVAAPPPSVLKPLIGSHVLVAAAQRDVRLQVRDAIKNLGLIVDFVNSMEEAADFCKDGLPHALVYEAALAGSTFERLRGDLVTEAPDFVFIEITKAAGGSPLAGIPGVPEDTIATDLPQALITELSKAM